MRSFLKVMTEVKEEKLKAVKAVKVKAVKLEAKVKEPKKKRKMKKRKAKKDEKKATFSLSQFSPIFSESSSPVYPSLVSVIYDRFMIGR